MPASSREDVRAGIVFVLASVFLFAGLNALIKWLTARYPINQVIFFRTLFSLAAAAMLVFAHGGLSGLRTQRLGEHAARACMQFMSMACMFTALSLMPLADAVALSFAAPMFMTMLSVPLLGERVGIHRWSAVVLGLVGVLIMLRPGPGVLQGGAVFALAHAFLMATVTVALRRMSLTEASSTLVFYQNLVAFLISIALLPLGWTAPTWTDLGLLAALGLGSGLAQFWWTQGFARVPAAIAAPFSYTTMVWSILFGYMIWGDLPDAMLLIGAAIVIASGLYIVYRETIRRTPKAEREPAAPRQD